MYYVIHRSFLYAFFILLILITSCVKGALSPEKAFSSLYSAFYSCDVKAMQELLSTESLRKIEGVQKMFSEMSDEQAEAASKLYNMTGPELKSLSVEKLINNFLLTEKDIILKGNAILSDVFENEDRAIVLLQNGNELDFVKEGRYWKFDLTKL